jgi:hypothetical protein
MRPFGLRLLLLLVLLPCFVPAVGWAEDQKPRTVIKQTLYIDPVTLTDTLGLLDVDFQVVPQQSAIVLRSSSEKDLETALSLITHLDAESRDLELRVHVLAALEKAGDPLPEAVDSVARELAKVFDYGGFELLETILLRAKDGSGAGIQGGFVGPDGAVSRYDLAFNRARFIPREKAGDPEVAQRGNRLRFDNFRFSMKTGEEPPAVTLRTDIEVREGQTAAVGKATPGGLGRALVILVEAEAVE